MSGYSSGGPGHDVARVVSNFTRAQFRTVLGTSVLDLLDATIPPAHQPAALCRAALWRLRSAPEDLPREELRDIFLDATPVENLAELAQRVGVRGTDALRRLQVEGDSENWSLFLGFYGLDLPTSSSTLHGSAVQTLDPEFCLFPHQRRVARQAYEAVRDGHGRVVLHMPTGTGKTRTTMRVVSRILEDSEPCLVVWLASSSELLEQAVDAFSTGWVQYGSRRLGVTRLWGQHSPSLSEVGDGLVVAGFQKAHALNTRASMDILRLGARTRLISAATRAPLRRRIVRVFRKPSAKPMVLCNYGVLTVGFDAPSTSACVIARPTKSLVLYSQMVGRATRGPLAGGNAACAVSTVVDVDLPGFRDFTEAFSNWEDVWT